MNARDYVALFLAASAGMLLSAAVQTPQPVQAESRQARRQVTWRRQIAPILFRNCTSCHHQGGSGPFSLTTYAEASRFASVIGPATATRYMPPWLPEPGHGEFAGSRRLPEQDIALLKEWLAQGAPEGTGPAPAPPRSTGEWQLGTPDLVLDLSQAISVPAGGSDLFTNVILPNPLKGTHWVRAMEIKPSTPQVVHHANVLLDRTASMRRTHADWQQGIPGMGIELDSGDSFDPDTHFLFWKPDSTALVEPVGMPWRLDEGNDLVLNLHLKPSGKAESTRARIALYFTSKPATEHPMLLQLEHDSALDIPAADSSFQVDDALTLPVAVKVLGIYPHAHYLAKRMEAWAMLPDGQRRDLLLIKNWDIDRQSVYRLSEPLPLPAKTTLHMRYTYDNSAANIHNPHSPPIRVRAGNRSEDEMAHFWLQVLPLPAPGMTELQASQSLEAAWMAARLEKNPADPIALYNLAALSLTQGQAAQAEQLSRRLLALEPDNARTLTALGSALEAEDKDAEAAVQFRAALHADQTYTSAGFNLAAMDLRENRLAEAEVLLTSVLSLQRDDTEAHRLLAIVYAGESKPAEAIPQLEAWKSLAPSDPEPHRALAQVLLQLGRVREALQEQQEVVKLSPASASDWNDLGVVEVRAGDMWAAGSDFKKAVSLDPGLATAVKNLSRLTQ